MIDKDFVLEIPYGTRDFLPKEAAEKRIIETSLADTFIQWGYEEVVTPTIEYLDTLTIGNGSTVEPHMFKFFDKNNRTLALRHEMTTPIARVAATRLKEEALPLKLSYISSVYRYEQAQTGRQCEFYQAGVEVMGSPHASADAEIIALAIEGLQKAGLHNFQICLGQVEFINGVMNQVGLPADLQAEIKYAMEKRDLVGLANIVEQTGLSAEQKQLLKEIPLLHGQEELIQRAYDLVVNEQSKRALDNLQEIYHLLQVYGVAEYVSFDLGVIRDFAYYTGMVFEAYTPGLGFPLCGGGRYDHMLTDFGNACPATGFAIGIERIMLALERQGLQPTKNKKDVYVAYAPGKAAKAIGMVLQLRQDGKTAGLSLKDMKKEDAETVCQSGNWETLVYVE